MQTSIPFSNYSFTLDGTTGVSGRTFHKGEPAFYSIVSSNFVRASGSRLLQGRDRLWSPPGITVQSLQLHPQAHLSPTMLYCTVAVTLPFQTFPVVLTAKTSKRCSPVFNPTAALTNLLVV